MIGQPETVYGAFILVALLIAGAQVYLLRRSIKVSGDIALEMKPGSAPDCKVHDKGLKDDEKRIREHSQRIGELESGQAALTVVAEKIERDLGEVKANSHATAEHLAKIDGKLDMLLGN